MVKEFVTGAIGPAGRAPSAILVHAGLPARPAGTEPSRVYARIGMRVGPVPRVLPGPHLIRSILAAILVIATPAISSAQQPQPKPRDPGQATIDDTMEAGEAEAAEPRRRLVTWNEYEGRFFTIRFGGGVLYDYAAYSQDEGRKQQFDLKPEGKFRDARVLLKGRLKFSGLAVGGADLLDVQAPGCGAARMVARHVREDGAPCGSQRAVR
jgi:hypothetical protein